MHLCAAQCCENDAYSVQKVHNCVENCSSSINKAQQYVEGEFERVQVRDRTYLIYLMFLTAIMYVFCRTLLKKS